jgi:hypothetical protein
MHSQKTEYPFQLYDYLLDITPGIVSRDPGAILTGSEDDIRRLAAKSIAVRTCTYSLFSSAFARKTISKASPEAISVNRSECSHFLH